jgi:hypothetical protein
MISVDGVPRTPPRRRDRDQDKGDDDDSRKDDEEGSGDDEGTVKKKICGGRRSWTQLGSWDRTALFESEIDHQILTLANERMEISGLVEWPQVRRKEEQKYIGRWAQNETQYRESCKVAVETYYCPLRKRTHCPVQIRVTRSVTSVILDSSGGEHTQELSHSNNSSKFLSFKQRIAVANAVKHNPAATGTDVRRTLQQLSPSRKVQPALARSESICSVHRKVAETCNAGQYHG